jgi:hypothetical protein
LRRTNDRLRPNLLLAAFVNLVRRLSRYRRTAILNLQREIDPRLGLQRWPFQEGRKDGQFCGDYILRLTAVQEFLKRAGKPLVCREQRSDLWWYASP